MYIVLGGNETLVKVASKLVYVAQQVKIKVFFLYFFVYTVHIE
jgi:hypothetical protein